MLKHVAIIDDEQEMEFIYSILLEVPVSQGLMRTSFFSDARSFLVWLENHTPDLVITDINMPHLTGPELGHCIRLSGKNSWLYLVSGDEEFDHTNTINKIPNCRYFTKPISMEIVRAQLLADLGLTSA